ncbi:hypothetical protein CCP3SC5AM1_370001 [Gammaproteobacteria bacterium]
MEHYQELNQRANQLAYHLQTLGVGPDLMVAICVERSLEIVIGILGILKAGGAYVPLDPNYPKERLAYMLADSKISVLLTQSHLQPQLPSTTAQIVCLEDFTNLKIGTPLLAIRYPVATNLAYVIYTSGSTGRPKGVMVQHDNVLAFLKSFEQIAPATHLRGTSVSSFSFDASVWELFSTLCFGGTLHILGFDTLADPDLLVKYLVTHEITSSYIAPALLIEVVNRLEAQSRPLKLERLLVGVEPIEEQVLQRYRNLSERLHIINGYGPTETSICATFFKFIGSTNPKRRTPIGTAVHGYEVYMLDSYLQPVPIGVAGELYIGGAGLARGYLNQPELTNAKFIPNPFGEGRLYKTGDLGRWLPEGNIEFIGRIDQQVKLRGFRIELGEIEATLTAHPAVKEAIVIMREDQVGNPCLTAYLTPETSDTATQSEHVQQWQNLYEETYRQVDANVDLSFNIGGWNSSYTGEPIPAVEMAEWVENTVAELLALSSSTILEIGCGSGLLLARLAPHCESYWGVDYSQHALNQVQQLIQASGLRNVILRQRLADDFTGIPSHTFDLVIINSVIQYFPSLDYLQRVIEGALQTLKPGGIIYVGDIRNFTLLEAYHASVQLYRAPDDLTRAGLAERVQQRVWDEEELLVAPAFFYGLPQRLPQIQGIEVRLKRGHYQNELTRFRYQVLLYLGMIPGIQSERFDWQREDWTLIKLRSYLAKSENFDSRALILRNVPNARIQQEIQTLGWLGETSSQRVADLRQILAIHSNGIDPEIFWALGEEFSYKVHITWSENEPGGMDVYFYKGAYVLESKSSNLVNRKLTTYANNPLLGKLHRRLVPQLREFLQSRLPDYMIPSAWITLDAWPLLPNGKINRKALPAPVMLQGIPRQQIVLPRTATEEMIASIWREVLCLTQVGIHDNFFELGGHSLLATQITSRLRNVSGIEVSVRQLFETPTLAGLSQVIDTTRVHNNLPMLRSRPESEDCESRLPLSFAQQRLWFITQLDGPNPVYNIPIALRLSGPLKVAVLEIAFNQIVQRHEILRTTFPTQDGVARQRIAPTLTVTLPVVDVSPSLESECNEWLVAEAWQPFDLVEGPLLRIKLYRLTETEHILLLNLHHIIADGWSMGVLFKEWNTLYSALLKNEPNPLPPLTIQYADFALWQREWLQGEVLTRLLAYWQQQLAHVPTLLNLPTDHPRPPVQSFRGHSFTFKISPELTTALNQFSRTQGVSLFMTLYAGFAILLSRYSGQEDIVIGVPIANRQYREIESLIGFFVNTLALRADLTGNPDFIEFLTRVRQMTLDSYKHQDIPFEQLVTELKIERSLSHHPLFQVMMTLNNTNFGQYWQLADVKVTMVDLEGYNARFDLLVALEETATQISGVVEYNRDLFEPATLARFIDHFQILLTGIVANPNQPIQQLPLLTTAERHQILVKWNGTVIDPLQSNILDFEKGIHQLFEEQVERTPDHIAVVFEERQLTYVELNQRANQLAHHLQTLQVGPDVLVGICAERSFDMIVGILGILKAGGAYVPLDPNYPKERLEFMVTDTKMPVLLTQEHLLPHLPQTAAKIVCLEDFQNQNQKPGLFKKLNFSSQSLAYVIYTSGSTGRPKGVMMPHQALYNLIVWQVRQTTVAPDGKTLQFAPISFDVSFQEIFSTFTTGGTLVLISEDRRRDMEALLCLLIDQRIQRIYLPFVALQNLSEVAVDSRTLPTHLKEVITAGEQLQITPAIANFFRQTGATLHNHYGPSETHVVTTYTLSETVTNWPTLPPIGRPIANVKLYILDSYLQPVPAGIPGELYLGGVCLARGYLHQPELTAEKFIANPFHNGRLYKTGDLVRWLPDGNIEFLGRIDHQVKIRGFRIELGEIEAVINQYPAVQQVVVMVHTDDNGQKRLHAYITGDMGPEDLTSGDLRSYLAQKLPDYMIPTTFMVLERFPMTPSGKVDRRALLEIGLRKVTQTPSDKLPLQTPTEEIIAAIWAEVLGLDRVGRDDNFFELGGHSLLATQVTSRLRKAFGFNVTVRQLFEHPVLSQLATMLSTTSGQRNLLTPPPLQLHPEWMPTDAKIPLSFAQQRFWFLDQLENSSPAYNFPIPRRLSGVLQVRALETSLNEIVQRHDILRTTFPAHEGIAYQQIAPAVPFTLSVITTTEAELPNLLVEEAWLPFDLARGPLLRIKLYRLTETEHVLLINCHHIIVDGWSIGLLFKELNLLYTARLQGKPSPLPPLAFQYADFSLWQRHWLQGETLVRQLAYWQQQLAHAPTFLNLSTDHLRPAIQTFNGRYQCFELTPELTAELKKLSRQQGVSLFMLLYAAFAVLLFRYSGQEDMVIGSTIANRHYREIEPLIGLFVNTLALRADLSGRPSFIELLRRVRQMILDSHNHQDIPFEQLVGELQIERSLSHTPLFQVMITLNNTTFQEVRQLGEVQLTWMDFDSVISAFDLTLSLAESDMTLSGGLEYNLDLFEPATIHRMIGHFKTLLRGIVDNPNQSIQQLPLLTEEERQLILVKWNDTGVATLSDQCLSQWFEARIEQWPDQIALQWEGQKMTYGELNLRANQIACYLQTLGVSPEIPVGVCTDRSPEMIIYLLAVLKTGGVYIPLDPELPSERLTFILSDAGAQVLLTSLTPQKIKKIGCSAALKVCTPESMLNLMMGTPKVLSTPENLAYIIYTSGTTGLPKGVMITHGSLSNHIRTMIAEYRITPRDKILQFSSISFDAALEQIFTALLGGATLVLRGDNLWSADEFNETVLKTGITTTDLPPAYFHELLDNWLVQPPAFLNQQLRLIIIGGEKISPDILKRWRQLFLTLPESNPEGLVKPPSTTCLINAYGPTETTITATRFELTSYQNHDSHLNIPIGLPLPGRRVYILDPELQPVPIGVAGELYIGGVNIARGYLNRPELTAAKFINNPFNDRLEGRVYKTGDLVRWQPNGNIEFLGRLDHQVKIRGFRIELGEIETVLSTHPAVQEAIVIARPDHHGQARLVAYLTLATEKPGLWSAELRSYLIDRLPIYMVPATFVVLQHFPLTTSGKLDQEALPEPDHDVFATISKFVPPQTPQEKQLTILWMEVLGLTQVGCQDDFFELGGNSLLALQLIAKISLAMNLKLSVKFLFLYSTIAQQVVELTTPHHSLFSPEEEIKKPGFTKKLSFAAEINLPPTITIKDLLPYSRNSVTTPKNILLTGATGFLGIYLLQELLISTKANIYCLVRASSDVDGFHRLTSKMKECQIWLETYRDRIIAVNGDLARPQLGLSDTAYDTLARHIDVIYHNGAMVNYLFTYSQLKATNISSTQDILTLATRYRVKPVHYVSTLGVLATDTRYPQFIFREEDELIAIPEGGYNQSKWVTEKLLGMARDRRIPVTIYRLGIVGGHSDTGIWNEKDYRCLLIKACLKLGKWPELNMKLEISPVDYVSRALVHLSLQPSYLGKTFHINNPVEFSYTQLFQQIIALGYFIQPMPYEEWHNLLVEQATATGDETLSFLIPSFTTESEQTEIEFKVDSEQTRAELQKYSIECPEINGKILKNYLKYLTR